MGSLLTNDQQYVVEMLQEHSENPSGFLALNDGNLYFRDPEIDGIICYRSVGRYWIQFGGPIAGAEDRGELFDRFRRSARRANRRVVAVQIPSGDAGLYAERGLRVNQLGMSYAVELADFSLRGKKFVKLRNKISRAGRLGVEPVEVGLDGHEAELGEIDRAWLRSKGRFTKEIEFMIGEVGGAAQSMRRLFLARLDGRPIAYISFSPVYGERPGWLHDLSRRLPDSPPGVMEAINSGAIEKFRAEGVPWLHFGFTPFTGLDPEHGLPTANPRVDRLFRLLATKGSFLYPAQSQLEYKMKWNPNHLVPDYIAFEGRVSPSMVFSLATVANLI
ncbi:bifunctional lysylphosphatidylglycerol flippase/synthetase MprF [Saccharothrix deserti]|uniref:bifunctional lysylphosphatidylglycerol flippase/synthetase MprF n=1 Tax=Saccharothrix deserti TaxID=2593674 RepID=UPI00131E6BFB|nr:DUF2156 domain-containing protein [Saccharothrix deserti]